MRLRLRTFLLFFLMTGCSSPSKVLAIPSPAAQDTLYSRPSQRLSLQIGTTGLGVAYARTLSERYRLTALAKASYLLFNSTVRVKTTEGSTINIKPDLVIGLVQAGLRWHPFSKRSVYLTAGPAYTWHPTASFTVTAYDRLRFGGFELSPQTVGTIHTAFTWPRFMVYTGVGLARFKPHRRLQVEVELGNYFMGRPSVQLQYNGFLEATTLDEKITAIEQNMAGYRFLPSIQVAITCLLQSKTKLK